MFWACTGNQPGSEVHRRVVAVTYDHCSWYALGDKLPLHHAAFTQVRNTKPEPKICPLCGEKVGLSAESVRVHIRLKHPEAYAELAGSEVSSPSGFSMVGSSGFSSPTAMGMQPLQLRPQQGQGEQAGGGPADASRAAAELSQALRRVAAQRLEQQNGD